MRGPVPVHIDNNYGSFCFNYYKTHKSFIVSYAYVTHSIIKVYPKLLLSQILKGKSFKWNVGYLIFFTWYKLVKLVECNHNEMYTDLIKVDYLILETVDYTVTYCTKYIKFSNFVLVSRTNNKLSQIIHCTSATSCIHRVKFKNIC